MTYDYCIVGQGLSGSLLAAELLSKGKTVLVVQSKLVTKSSEVAPGMFNPLVLKRFTLAWKAPLLIPFLKTHYESLEKEFKQSFIQNMDLYRLFHDDKERNLWIDKTDQLALEPFMDASTYPVSNSKIEKQIGLGKVLHTGRVVLKDFIQAVSKRLKETDSIVNDCFDYEALSIQGESFSYKSYHFDKIIFAEGYGLKGNPWFKYLPLKGTKGELITIHAPDLKLKSPIKSSVLVMPLGNDMYRVGASFNWDDKDAIPTNEGKEWLISKLKQIINCNFDVIEHDAGIRPTVVDRRPLIGEHPEHKNMFVFNGMGTRGVMLAPFGVKMLLNNIELNTPIDDEWDIKRFTDHA